MLQTLLLLSEKRQPLFLPFCVIIYDKCDEKSVTFKTGAVVAMESSRKYDTLARELSRFPKKCNQFPNNSVDPLERSYLFICGGKQPPRRCICIDIHR